MEASSVFHMRGENFFRVETIGERILAFATAKNEGVEWGAQTALAALLEMSTQQLSSYVKGGSMPGPDVLRRFRDVGVSVEWLLFGEGEMLSPEPLYPSELGNRGEITGRVTLPSDRLTGVITINGVEIEIELTGRPVTKSKKRKTTPKN